MQVTPDSVSAELERREYPRMQTAHKISYEHFDAQGVKVGEGDALTVNLSGRGALIETFHELDGEGSLIVWIFAPFYIGVYKGRILHSRQMANQRFRMGVQLTDVIEGHWQALEQLVNQNRESSHE